MHKPIFLKELQEILNSNQVLLSNIRLSSGTPPAGLTVIESGASCSSVALSGVSTSGATLNVSGCSGTGTITVNINAEVIENEKGELNAASTTQVVQIDNTKPVVAIFSVSKPVTTESGANTVVALFNKKIQGLSASNANSEFTVVGCSGTNPVASIVMSTNGSGHSVATATLSAGACLDGETVDVDFHLDKVTDMAGNAGDIADNPSTLSYDIDTLLPMASLVVTNAIVGSTSADNTVTATFNKIIAPISATNTTQVFTITGCTTAPAVAVSMSDDGAGHSIAVATLSGGACADASTVSVALNLDKVFDAAGNHGQVADNPTPVSYTVDTAAASISLDDTVYSNGLTSIDSSESAELTITLSHTASHDLVAASGSSGSAPAGITVVESGASCAAVNLVNVNATTWKVEVSGCTMNGSIDIQVDANMVTGYSGVKNPASVIRSVSVVN